MTPANFLPELRLLFHAARPYLLNEESETLADLLGEDLDWERFLDLCRYHRVAPIVFRNLSALRDKVPAEVLERLHDWTEQNVRRNFLFWKNLVGVLDALHERDIRSVPLKGPVLSWILYGDVGRRQFRDLDLLVSAEQTLAAFEVLRELGYRSEEALHELRSRNQLLFRKEDGTVLELHWRLSHTPGAFPVELGTPDRWTELRVTNRTVSTLSMEDLFLFLCHHGSFHVWERLSWLTDIRAFVALEERCDWREVSRLATGLGMEREVSLTLDVAFRLLGTTPPEALARFLEPPRAPSRVTKEVHLTLGRRTPTPLHSSEKSWARKWRTLFYQLRLKPSLAFRWQAVVMALRKAIVQLSPSRET